MKKPSEKNPSKPFKRHELSDHEMIGQLAECIHASLRKELTGELDPFESYTYRLKIRLQQNNDEFKKRLIQGYDILLETLQP